MGNLILNEWIKIFRQVGTYIMLGLLVFTVVATGFITMYYHNNVRADYVDWKEGLAAENLIWEEQLSGDTFLAVEVRNMAKKNLAINEYRLANDMPPARDYDFWRFTADSASFTSFAGLFVIIIAAGIVANEFSWGTIKVLLVKPFQRWKFLFAKYVTVVLFMAFTLAILFISVLAVGALLFGSSETTSNVHLAYVNGAVVEKSLLLHLIKTYVLKSLGVFLLATMAFMISAAFRVSGLAIGISIFLLLMGGAVTGLLASQFKWAKYILFANTDLNQYIDGVPLIEGMTMSFSITMLIIYFVIFQALAYFFFTKRDVAT